MYVMSALETSRELIRHSSYRYEFATVAVTHSLLALEHVLAERLATNEPLHTLIERARRELDDDAVRTALLSQDVICVGGQHVEHAGGLACTWHGQAPRRGIRPGNPAVRHQRWRQLLGRGLAHRFLRTADSSLRRTRPVVRFGLPALRHGGRPPIVLSGCRGKPRASGRLGDRGRCGRSLHGRSADGLRDAHASGLPVSARAREGWRSTRAGHAMPPAPCRTTAHVGLTRSSCRAFHSRPAKSVIGCGGGMPLPSCLRDMPASRGPNPQRSPKR